MEKNIYEIIWLVNELDLLDLRLHELKDVVKKHIIVEHPFSCSGAPQKMHYNENKERFKEFEDRIIHIIDDHDYFGVRGHGLFRMRLDSPKVHSVLRDICEDNAFILSADGDVIVKSSVFGEKFDPNKITVLYLEWANWWFNHVTTSTVFTWTTAVPWRLVRQYGLDRMTGINDGSEFQHIGDAGWHFSKCGGAEAARECIMGHPHQESNLPEFTDLDKIQKRIDNGWGWNIALNSPNPKGDWNWEYRKFEKSKYPKYLEDNPQIYSKYFKGGM